MAFAHKIKLLCAILSTCSKTTSSHDGRACSKSCCSTIPNTTVNSLLMAHATLCGLQIHTQAWVATSHPKCQSRNILSQKKTAASYSLAPPRAARNRPHAPKTKPKSSLLHGYAMHKTILWTMLGSAAALKISSTPRIPTTLGPQITNL